MASDEWQEIERNWTKGQRTSLKNHEVEPETIGVAGHYRGKDEPQTLAAAIPEVIFSPNVWSKRVLTFMAVCGSWEAKVDGKTRTVTT
jgi:hypothetical protein